MSEQARVLFFATLREKTGVKETTIEFPSGTSILDIKKMLLDRYPDLKASMETIIVAMNHEFAFDETLVPDGAEIALFPPVSGGALEGKVSPTIIAIVENEINLNEIVAKITGDTTGAACVFSGIVRRLTRRGLSRETNLLEYEAYQVMAESKMKQIAAEIRARWMEVDGIALIQRTGKLLPGMVSVAIACSSAHRDSGIFEAARYGIDRLKEIVPIWKKEVAKDGEEWVEGEYIPHRGE